MGNNLDIKKFKEALKFSELNPPQPDIILVPSNMEEMAHKLLETKTTTLSEIGSYRRICEEYKGETTIYWYRRRELKGNRGYFPRTDGYYEQFYYTTRAMKKRGYPHIMNNHEWNEFMGNRGKNG